jgi:hypothetical protein
MLFGTGDSSAMRPQAAGERRRGRAGAIRAGPSNALIRALRAASGRSVEQFSVFARTALFEPIGMRDAVFEIDAAGCRWGRPTSMRARTTGCASASF